MTEYVTFNPPDVAAVKMLNRPPFFDTFAATIRHRDLIDGSSSVEYKYTFTARPSWMRWLLHPVMAAVFRWETRKRLRALRQLFSDCSSGKMSHASGVVEPSQAPEPAAGPVSSGESSPPVRWCWTLGTMSGSIDFSWMVGRLISSVQLNGPTQWSFSFEPGVAIGAECPWRLLQGGHVAISSEDHLQQYGLPAPLDAAAVAASLLSAHSVTLVEVKEGTADLLLEFAGGLRLEFIPMSSGYESWIVTTPSGFQVIAQGGGQLCGCQG